MHKTKEKFSYFFLDETADVSTKNKERLKANLDDLELRWPETTTEEPDYPSTTFDPPIVTVKQSSGEYYYTKIIFV